MNNKNKYSGVLIETDINYKPKKITFTNKYLDECWTVESIIFHSSNSSKIKKFSANRGNLVVMTSLSQGVIK